MSYQWDGQAIYIPQGDTLQVKLYLHDTADNKFHPEQVRMGLVEVLFGDTVIRSRTFDRRFGNSDGAFKMDLVGPKQAQGLQVRATITLLDGTTRLVAMLPVTLDTSGEANTPVLGEQPQVPNQTYGLLNTAS